MMDIDFWVFSLHNNLFRHNSVLIVFSAGDSCPSFYRKALLLILQRNCQFVYFILNNPYLINSDWKVPFCTSLQAQSQLNTSKILEYILLFLGIP